MARMEREIFTGQFSDRPVYLPKIRVAIFSVCGEDPAELLLAKTRLDALGFSPLFAAECAAES
jgi:hypothetical protein